MHSGGPDPFSLQKGNMKGFRTILFNVVTALGSTGAAVTDVVPNSNIEWTGVVIAICNIILRMLTTTSVGQSK